jgi:hypothetical protein
VEELEEPLERRKRRGADILLGESRLDRLEEPIAEVVEGEVVETIDCVREVVRGEVGLELGARGVDAREDPALLDRSGPRLRLDRSRKKK